MVFIPLQSLKLCLLLATMLIEVVLCFSPMVSMSSVYTKWCIYKNVEKNLVISLNILKDSLLTTIERFIKVQISYWKGDLFKSRRSIQNQYFVCTPLYSHASKNLSCVLFSGKWSVLIVLLFLLFEYPQRKLKCY